MPSAGGFEPIEDQRPLTLILRLVIAADRGLVHGEIVSLEGFVYKRFAHWQELISGLEQVIADLPYGSMSNG